MSSEVNFTDRFMRYVLSLAVYMYSGTSIRGDSRGVSMVSRNRSIINF